MSSQHAAQHSVARLSYQQCSCMHECLHANFGCTHAACICLHVCPSACRAKRIAVHLPSHADWHIGIATLQKSSVNGIRPAAAGADAIPSLPCFSLR